MQDLIRFDKCKGRASVTGLKEKGAKWRRKRESFNKKKRRKEIGGSNTTQKIYFHSIITTILQRAMSLMTNHQVVAI